MRLFSRNLLMSKPSEQYEVLDSLKINPKCYFILDETEFLTWNYNATITVDADDSLTKGTINIFLYGSSSDKTNCAVTYLAQYPMLNFLSNGKNWLTPTYLRLRNKIKAKIVRTSATSTQVAVCDENNTTLLGQSITSDFVSSKGNFGIFGSTETNSTFKGNFYNFTLTIEGETVYDLVPARRNSDGEFGLLNKVDGKFYENQGTGTLERGEENA